MSQTWGKIKRMYVEMVELRAKLDADQAETARLKEACRDVWDYDNDTPEEGNWIYTEDE